MNGNSRDKFHFIFIGSHRSVDNTLTKLQRKIQKLLVCNSVVVPIRGRGIALKFSDRTLVTRAALVLVAHLAYTRVEKRYARGLARSSRYDRSIPKTIHHRPSLKSSARTRQCAFYRGAAPYLKQGHYENPYTRNLFIVSAR